MSTVITENIKKLMIIDEFNRKSIKKCGTCISYNKILYKNDGILFNIQIYGHKNKDNNFGLCFNNTYSKYYLIKINEADLYNSIHDAIVCHYYEFCLCISETYLLLMFQLDITKIYFNFVICIHEIKKIFNLSIQKCILCGIYSYGVYNNICSLCYNTNNYDILIKKYTNVLEVVNQFIDYDKHNECIKVYLESIVMILKPDEMTFYNDVNIKLKLYMITHILSNNTRKNALLNMMNSSFFIIAKLNEYVLYSDVIEKLIADNIIKIGFIITFEYIKYHYVLIIAMLIQINNKKYIIRFIYRTCRKGYIIQYHKNKIRLEKLLKYQSFTINKNIRLDALNNNNITVPYKNTHSYISKTLLNYINTYESIDIKNISYIKILLEYMSNGSTTIYKKQENYKKNTIIQIRKHENDKEISWTELYFDANIKECYDEKHIFCIELPKALLVDDEITNDIRHIQYNSIFCKFLIFIDDFLYNWFGVYRNKCITCNIDIKVNYHGECNKCAFLRKKYEIINDEYKKIIDFIINKVPINMCFLNVFQEIYDKTLILDTNNCLIERNRYKLSIIKKRILGNLLLLYMKKCDNNMYIKKYENVMHTDNLEYLYCKKSWNIIISLMFIELNIEKQLNISIKREVKIKNYFRFFDFVCYGDKKKCIIIEIDDRSHNTIKNKNNDSIKNKICNENNLLLIRFSIRNYEYGILDYIHFLDHFLSLIHELKTKLNINT